MSHAVVTDTGCQSYQCFLKINKEQINWIPKMKGVKIREEKLTGNRLKKHNLPKGKGQIHMFFLDPIYFVFVASSFC